MLYDEDVDEADVIGGTLIPAAKLCQESGLDEWITIKYKGISCGKVHMRVRFTPSAKPEFFKPTLERRKTFSIQSRSNETILTFHDSEHPATGMVPDEFETVLGRIKDSPIAIMEQDEAQEAALRIQKHFRRWTVQ